MPSWDHQDHLSGACHGLSFRHDSPCFGSNFVLSVFASYCTVLLRYTMSPQGSSVATSRMTLPTPPAAYLTMPPRYHVSVFVDAILPYAVSPISKLLYVGSADQVKRGFS
ncbi:hypothetical protein PTI98_009801 [Pleurotus ostreatus]|nr:hypothetical protein PTI98_009801 [Pleurotus ostreatus]